MAYADRVKESSTSTGTGSLSLAGAASGFRTFAAGFTVGATMPYAISDALGNWEIGTGTLSASTTLARTTVLASSNGNALVNFPSGSKDVFCTASADALTKMDQSTSARVYHLTKMGAVDDADLSAGSTTFGTDSTAAIQAVLNLASATNPIRVIFDGRFSTTGLRVKGNTAIEALPGCGAILRTGSNKTLLENYNLSFNPATRADKNISIQGGIWNGNRGSNGGSQNNNGTNNSKGNPTVGLNCIMRFYGVENLTINPDQMLNSPSYSSHVMNCKRVRSSHVKHDVGTNWIVNNDGHNTGGYCEDIVYRDLTISGFDDPLSISPDDVWGMTGSFVYPYYPISSMGQIKNVLVDNLNLQSLIYGVRLMSGTGRLDNVMIRNVTGYTTAWAILLDNYNAEGGLPGAVGTGNIGTVTIDGVDVALTGTAVIRIKSSAEKIIIRNLHRSSFGDACPTILIDGTNVTIGSLEIDGYDSSDTASSFVVPHIKMVGGTINELKLTNFRVRRTGAANGSVLLQLTGGATIGTLQASNVTLERIDNLLANASGTVSRISATNIVHLNPTAGQATFSTASTIARINLSGYIGDLNSSGTFSQKTGDGFVTVVDTTAPTALSAAVANAAPTFVDIPMSETMDTAFTPAAASVTVSGHTVSALSWFSSTVLRATVSAAFVNGEAARTVAYTQPGTNNARDLSGNLLANFTALAITNNVAAASFAALAFPIGDSTITNSGSNVWTTTRTGYPTGGYNTYGRAASVKIAAGQDGMIRCQHPSGLVGIYTSFGLATTSSASAAIAYGVILYENTATFSVVTNGNAVNGSAEVVGNYYAIRRAGTTVTLETSADGSTWTVVYTWGGTSSTDLYPMFYLAADPGANLYHPEQIGFA